MRALWLVAALCSCSEYSYVRDVHTDRAGNLRVERCTMHQDFLGGLKIGKDCHTTPIAAYASDKDQGP